MPPWKNWDFKIMEFNHYSVMLEECIAALDIKPDGIYVDCTAGGAGHSAEIAAKLTTGMLYALDKDPFAVKTASERLEGLPARVIECDFRDFDRALADAGVTGVDGILADLGVSSHQLDRAERGFSYRSDAPLDMRMSGKGLSAYDVVNTYSEKELSHILRKYAEEKFAPRIARAIVREREQSTIDSTLRLADIVKNAIPAAARREGGHPAKRSFQAIRIEVNGEIEALEEFLDKAAGILNPGGRLAIITFHSLEDRPVKEKFRELSAGCTCPKDFPVCVCGNTPKVRLASRKPVLPSARELETNNRSHSAKLRVCEKL